LKEYDWIKNALAKRIFHDHNYSNLAKNQLKKMKNIKNSYDENITSRIFILVTYNYEKDDVIIDKIKKINSVIDVQKTVGVYDLIVTLNVSSIGSLKKTILDKIRNIEGVNSTMTLCTDSNKEILC